MRIPSVRFVVVFNSNVSAFTSGRISRFSPVYLIFNRDIPADKATTEFIEKIMTVKPSVKGTWNIDGTNAIVFTPDGSFDRNTVYNITADIGDLFDIEDKAERRFSFAVETAPLTMTASLDGIEQHENGDTILYDVTATVTTSDREDAALIESLVGTSENEIAEWTHSNDGTRHTLIVKDIKGAEKARIITLSVISDKKRGDQRGDTRGGDTIRRRLLGIRRRLCDRPVGIHRGDFHTDPRSQTGYVGLSLSRRRRRGAHRKKGNKLRIYPSERHAAYTCVNLDENIRSAKGNTLGENLFQGRHKTVATVGGVRRRGCDSAAIGQGGNTVQRGISARGTGACHQSAREEHGAVFAGVRHRRQFRNNAGGTLGGSQNGHIRTTGRSGTHQTQDIRPSTSPTLSTPNPEPYTGVELSFDRNLSVYRPCDDEWQTLRPTNR